MEYKTLNVLTRQSRCRSS